MSVELLNYYNEQLSYLRRQGRAFAAAHPKIASHLQLGPGEIDDPSVAVLLEGFAFLTARIQHNIDQGNRTITENLINLLYPHHELSLPAFSIIQFTPIKNSNTAFTIPRHKSIRMAGKDMYCMFRTCHETDVLPLQISNISWKRHFTTKPQKENDRIRSCLGFELSGSCSGFTFKKSGISTVRFYINLEKPHNYRLYEILRTDLAEISISIPGLSDTTIEISLSDLNFAGFDDTETLLPFPENSCRAYGLLTEFFSYPERFLFFDIPGIDKLNLPVDTAKISVNLFFETDDAGFGKNITDGALLLNCVPIINLFEQIGEPVRVDPNQLEYNIIADNNTPISNMEVYDILGMKVTQTAVHESKIEALPYFGKRYAMKHNPHHIYWHSFRKKCWEIGEYQLNGTETYAVFSQMNPDSLQKNTPMIITPELLCTNREAALSISAIMDNPTMEFYPEKIELIAGIKSVTHLTKPRYRERRPNLQIDLLTHLSINQTGFDCGSKALDTLKNCLSLYNIDNTNEALMIDRGLCGVETRNITARQNNSLKQNFCYGVEYTLTVDEHYFPEKNVLLFSAVLQAFLQRMSSINSFTQLIIVSKQRGIIKKWEPLLGKRRRL